MKKNISVIVGSDRKGSFNQIVADYMMKTLKAEYNVKQVEIMDLPLYSENLETENKTPTAWREFREELAEADAFLFVTPEYNRSMPASIKNALDVGSRPYGENNWAQKPAAVISVSPGAIGGFGANHHLRQVATFLDLYMMQQPEVYISNVTDVLDEQQNIKQDTKDFLDNVSKAYSLWISKF